MSIKMQIIPNVWYNMLDFLTNEVEIVFAGADTS